MISTSCGAVALMVPFIPSPFLWLWKHHSLSRVVVPATLTQHLCQRSFHKIFVKFRNNKKNVLKIALIIVNINKDENKSLISNQFSEELFCGGKNLKVKNDHTSFLRENWFEMSDLFSSLLIPVFTIIKTILSTFFYCF